VTERATGPIEMSIDLDPAPHAIAAARRAIERLKPVADGQTLDLIKLMVSEIVTNSVRHSGARPPQRIGLQVRASDSQVRVVVTDPGPGFDRVERVADPMRTSGWGLILVGQIADRWGVTPGDPTKVWFELSLSNDQVRSTRET
jgi:anti-sigma regulatory factor (Ser/Thr protein kinase)